MPEQSAQIFADVLLSRWVMLLGAPGRLLTDQRANFESAIVYYMCTIWRIEKVRSTAYQAAGNGVCERLNQRIKGELQEILNQKMLEEWDIVLSEVMFA